MVLRDLGAPWIKVGLTNSGLASGYKRAYTRIGWKTRTIQDEIWVRPPTAPVPHYLHHKVVVNANNYREPAKYRAIEKYSMPGAEDFALPVYDPDSRRRAAERIVDDSSWRGWLEIRRLLFYCQRQERANLLLHSVAPAFFDHEPDGRIDFLYANEIYMTHMHLLRKLFLMLDSPGADPERLLNVFPETLSHLRSFSGQAFPETEVSILFTMFYPKIYGFLSPQSTSVLVFHFGTDADASQPFPPSFEHWWRPSGAFQENGEKGSRILDGATRGELSELEPILPSAWDRNQWLALFDWYLRRLENLLHTVLDFSRFASKDRQPRYEVQFKTLLTLMHIAEETVLSLLPLPPFITKTLTCDIIDQYAALRAGGKTDGAEVAKFKEIVSKNWLLGPLSDSFKSLPSPFSVYFRDQMESVWNSIESSILKGVFVKDAVPAPEAVDNFVPQVLRALRNTRHGFFLRPNQFAPLASHNANLSDRFPAIGALLWIALLAEPRLFLEPLIIK